MFGWMDVWPWSSEQDMSWMCRYMDENVGRWERSIISLMHGWMHRCMGEWIDQWIMHASIHEWLDHTSMVDDGQIEGWRDEQMDIACMNKWVG